MLQFIATYPLLQNTGIAHCISRGQRSKLLTAAHLCPLGRLFYLSKHCRPDKMPPYAASQLGFHCLSKYLTGIQIEKHQSLKLNN